MMRRNHAHARNLQDHRALEPGCDVAVVPASLGWGQPKAGVEKAHQALVDAGVFDQLAAFRKRNSSEVFRRFVEVPLSLAGPHSVRGDVEEHFGHQRELGLALGVLAQTVMEHARREEFVLTIGGDHSVAVGSLAGLCAYWQNLGVVWVDAHGDFNSPETSPSGNFHGMPLAALCGAFELGTLAHFEWFRACLDPKNVVIIGARNLDPGEAELLQTFGVRMFPAEEVARRGMPAVMGDAMGHLLAQGPRPLHLSFDVDALDAPLVPGTGTPEPDGLSLDDALVVCQELRRSGLLVGMDLVEINPDLEKISGAPAQKTLSCAAALLRKALLG